MAIIKNPFMVVGDKNPLIANNEDELNALLTSKNAGKAVLYSGELYIVEGGEATENPTAVQLYTTPAGVPMTASTEEEANALLVENNVGKVFKYIGEGGGAAVGTPFAVGDTIGAIYLNTSATPDLSKIALTDGYATLLQATGANSVLGIWVVDLSVGTSGIASGYAIAQSPWEGAEIVDFPYSKVIYSSTAFEIEPDGKGEGGMSVAQGWNTDLITSNGAYEWRDEYDVEQNNNGTVTAVNQQDLWGSYISKEPFAAGAGAYEKDALYLIASESNAPIAVGDTIDKLYFDTSLSDEEMLTNLNALTYNTRGQAIMLYSSESEYDNVLLSAVDMSVPTSGATTCKYIFDIQNQKFIYATEDVADYGITKGWQNLTDGVYTISTSHTITAVNQQDLWSSYISKEPFTGGGGGVTAKKLQVAE